MDLIHEMLIEGVADYERLKKGGLIQQGRANIATISRTERMPRNMYHDEVDAVCDFIWGGWMEGLIEEWAIRINAEAIYQKLEPKLWTTLISRHRKASATSH